MENTESRLYFASDYMEGAHPAIMKKLMETNLEKTVGYGQDPYTEDAKEKIRKACTLRLRRRMTFRARRMPRRMNTSCSCIVPVR